MSKIKVPRLPSTSYDYNMWISSLPYGTTPSGERIIQVNFVLTVPDPYRPYKGHPVEFKSHMQSGSVVLLNFSKDHETGEVALYPGSLLAMYSINEEVTNPTAKVREWTLWVCPRFEPAETPSI
jgi:hypothetical protein